MPGVWVGRGSPQVYLGSAWRFQGQGGDSQRARSGQTHSGKRIVRRGCAVVFLLASIAKGQSALLKTESQQVVAHTVSLEKNYEAIS